MYLLYNVKLCPYIMYLMLVDVKHRIKRICSDLIDRQWSVSIAEWLEYLHGQWKERGLAFVCGVLASVG